MEQNKKQFLDYLDAYGSCFENWPVVPGAADQQEIKGWEEYAQAQRLDRDINAMDWPMPSSGLKQRVMQQCARKAIEAQGFILMIKRPYMLVSCFVIFLCLGLSINSLEQSQAYTLDHQSSLYYSSTSASLYGALSGGTYAQ